MLPQPTAAQPACPPNPPAQPPRAPPCWLRAHLFHKRRVVVDPEAAQALAVLGLGAAEATSVVVVQILQGLHEARLQQRWGMGLVCSSGAWG